MFKKLNDNKKNRFMKFFSNLFFKFRSLSLIKLLFIFYVLITLFGSLLLLAPLSQQNNSIPYIDCLFTAASAFSDTGLVTSVTAAEWTEFGQAIIAILIFIGGIGWFALKIYIFQILFGRPIGFVYRQVLATERGSSRVGDTRSIIKVSVSSMFIIIAISTIILSIYFFFSNGNFGAANTYFENGEMFSNAQGEFGFLDSAGNFRLNSEFNPNGNFGQSFKFGLFHSISALNNAGFDIMGAHSIAPYYSDYFVQIMFIILFIIGGLGYPVIYDIYSFFKSKIKGNTFRWTLFTKVSTLTYLLLTIFGLISTFSIELTVDSSIRTSLWNGADFGTNGEKTMAIIFHTFSTRNAGFSTVSYQAFSNNTLLIHSILMFIGSAPSSTAGGIRTTTFAIIILSIWKMLRNKESVNAFKRRIKPETVNQAFTVFLISIILVFISFFVVSTSITNSNEILSMGVNNFEINSVDIIFETVSAFGTTGLSTGITNLLNPISKIVLILIMFIGQLGVSSTLSIGTNKSSNSRKYKYIEENIAIG